MQSGFGLNRVSGFAYFSWFPQCSISDVFVKQKCIAFGTTMTLNHRSAVFCFLQNSFWIHLVVLLRICQGHSVSPHHIKKYWKCIFTPWLGSYRDHRQWGQQTMKSLSGAGYCIALAKYTWARYHTRVVFDILRLKYHLRIRRSKVRV